MRGIVRSYQRLPIRLLVVLNTRGIAGRSTADRLGWVNRTLPPGNGC
jgi:hypothetical protein